MSVKLSLVIPVYNAETFIFDSAKRLNKWYKSITYRAEIIYINDGSTDNTLSILNGAIEGLGYIKLISYRNNKGKGYAVKKGMLIAEGEFRIFTDADIPYGFVALEKII